MRPIFTVHAGEYLVACEIETRYKNHQVWIPSKDSGIDLLVTDLSCQKVASIQVKFSKDKIRIRKGRNPPFPLHEVGGKISPPTRPDSPPPPRCSRHN